MRKAILLAGILAFGVLMLFVGIIVSAGKTLPGNGVERVAAAAEPRFVPPLERIVQERQSADAAKKEAYHTKAPPPKLKIFQTSYKEGTQVTFNHAKHVDVHKLNCIECHHVERCSKCHSKGETRTLEVVKGKQAMHENCIGCHAETSGPEQCLDCHKQ
jgi:primosomal protein N'